MQGLDWDGGNFYHPDERSIYMRAECMHLTLTEQPGWQSCQNRDFPKDAPGLPGVSVFFDKDLINSEMLNKFELEWINEYHQSVFKKLSKFLTYEERSWLQKVTMPI